MSNLKILSPEEIEQLRDRRYRRNKYLQVRSIDVALEFINDVGFCFAFSAKNSELPCLWHAACGKRDPVMPEHTHHDPYISLVWETKDVLPAQQKVYYGKVLKKRPTFISLEYFPYFYALIAGNRPLEGYLSEYMRGELSLEAKKIMDALTEHSPQITRDLKLSSGMSHPKQRYAFDQAMAELQMKMYLLKIAEFYDPFTFLWDLVPNRFPAEVQQSNQLSLDAARFKILQQYFKNVIVANLQHIQRLFGWSKEQIESALEALQQKDIITNAVEIAGEKGRWFALVKNF